MWADEFFYVLKGEGEVLIEDKLYTMKEGEGIMVRAGKKHKRRTPNVCWLVIAKHPHEYTHFEE
ncbi:cupin domain-containing protein [Chloroflexota bacterium]